MLFGCGYVCGVLASRGVRVHVEFVVPFKIGETQGLETSIVDATTLMMFTASASLEKEILGTLLEAKGLEKYKFLGFKE